MKQIIIHVEKGETHVAMLEDRKLVEFYAERQEEKHKVGNIYMGKVMNVLPGMQAAFVNIGQEKNAFLYIDDLLPAHLEKQPKIKPHITELVKVGQEIMVQVAKEPVGAKGARVTTHFSLPGRWAVYMPNADYVGVSRKIEEESERNRLKDLAESLRKNGEGLIIRTVADGAREEELIRDLMELRATWNSIGREALRAKAPSCIYRDLDLVPRVVRDMIKEDMDEIVLDAERTGEEMAAMLREVSPSAAERIKLHQSQKPIYEAYGVEEELDRSLRRKVWLESGGYINVDLTEALTVIDVNTGKYTGTEGLEETVFQTNMEAAREIARLLRLRDIGGIIIIDFIDMSKEEHRTKVLQLLSAETRKDRTKTNILGWTKLGLVEVTRKKVRETMDELLAVPCPECKGRGRLLPVRN